MMKKLLHGAAKRLHKLAEILEAGAIGAEYAERVRWGEDPTVALNELLKDSTLGQEIRTRLN